MKSNIVQLKPRQDPARFAADWRKQRGGALGLDKSYNFVDKDPIVEALLAARRRSGKPLARIAYESDLTLGTVVRLFEGKTKSPHLRTIRRLAKVFGLQLTLNDGRKARLG